MLNFDHLKKKINNLGYFVGDLTVTSEQKNEMTHDEMIAVA